MKTAVILDDQKDNTCDYAHLHAHIRRIFPDRKLEEMKIQRIGGLSNKNFKIEMDGKAYVLRVPGNGSEGMVDRFFEEENSTKASRIGVNPKLRFFDRQSGLKLVDFISGAETLDGKSIQQTENLIQVAQILKMLHQSSILFNNDFNPFQEILSYEQLLEKSGAVMYEGYEELRNQIFGLEAKLEAYGVDLKPCHNDMVAENFVKSESGKIYLIDWEYSGMNDPHWEFAALFLENDFTREKEDFFLHQYFGDVIPTHSREKILIYEVLADVLWAMWTCIKEKAGDYFGSYGKDRFDRGCAHLQLVR